MDLETKRRELAQLRKQVSDLESEILSATSSGTPQWPPREFYGMYYATSGFLLGAIAAAVSLVCNALLAPLAGKSPLELIKVYLTFPMGERALAISAEQGSGLILALGVTLYIGTGMLLGVPLYWLMVRICGRDASLGKRMVVGVVIALILWFIAFYGVLSWFQPMLLGGNWITDPSILPPWVAAGTHVIFGMVMAMLYRLGLFTPYRPVTTEAS
ncbi:MAG: hypothetical protein ACK5Q5_10690 [Planctomycetaceae bacterium]